MSILKVQTSQNVLLAYNIGNIGQRFAAAFLDLLLMLLYFWFMQFILSRIFSFDLFEGDPNILAFFIVSLPIIFYQPVIEYLWNGKTVGKRLLNLKVVRNDGTAASLGDYVLRWVLRPIDVKLGFLFIFFAPSTPTSSWEQSFMFLFAIFMVIPFPVVGIISMAVSKQCQRIGDRVANTVVIKKSKKYSLEDTILQTTQQNYEPRYKNVLQLSDKDINIIKNVLENFEKTRDYTNIMKIASKAREILNIQDDEKDLPFLKTLIKDYNYLGRKEEEEIK